MRLAVPLAPAPATTCRWKRCQLSVAGALSVAGILCVAFSPHPQPLSSSRQAPARVSVPGMRGRGDGQTGRREVVRGGTALPLTVGGLLLSPGGRQSLAQEGGSEETEALVKRALTSTSSLPKRFEVPDMGIGAWAWGDQLFWQYDKKNDAELDEVFNYCIENGVNFFDTAEIYGFGRSEKLLGDFDRQYNGQPAKIASKFAPLPWRGSRTDVVKACKNSLERLGKDQIDLYQIHFPGAAHNKDYWDGIGDCYEQGLVKAVGVSNYGVEALTQIKKELDKRSIPLTSNQIQYSLLYRFPEENGLKQACDDLGVKILAYSPLCLGLLTGKYSKDRLPKGPRALIAKKLLQDPAYIELLDTMQKVADAQQATKPQVALAWCIAKGTCPIPGARNLRQAKENVAALQLKLSRAEVELLDNAASRVSSPVQPENNPFPKYDKELGIRMYQS